MSEEKKDLSHYLNNPDELGDMSDEALEALVDSQSAAEDPTPAEPKGDTESAATPGDTAGEKQDPDDKPAETPDGILARDGKHIIPYSRLEDAERRARELAAKVEELSKQQQAGEPAAKDAKPADETEGFLSDEELDELESELPALAKVIRAQQAQVRHLSGEVSELRKGYQTQQQDDETKSWTEALAQNPKAQYLDATLAPEVGQRFINAAATIYADTWDTMPHAERAAAIVRQYEAVHGEIQVKQAAQATKPAQPAKKPDVPVSMGGIPGGAAPAVDEAAAMASKTGSELTADFMNMTPEQIEATLNRI